MPNTAFTGQIRELSSVVLTRTIEVQGVSMPAGSRGAVMHVYSDGLAYEVEFCAPRHEVLTVEAADLKLWAP